MGGKWRKGKYNMWIFFFSNDFVLCPCIVVFCTFFFVPSFLVPNRPMWFFVVRGGVLFSKDNDLFWNGEILFEENKNKVLNRIKKNHSNRTYRLLGWNAASALILSRWPRPSGNKGGFNFMTLRKKKKNSRKTFLYNCIYFANDLPDSLPNFIKLWIFGHPFSQI